MNKKLGGLVALTVSLTLMTAAPVFAAGWIDYDGACKYQREDGTYIQEDWLELEGKWYYFNKEGRMISGWHRNTETNQWYWLEENGELAVDTVKVIYGDTYKIDENGVCHELESYEGWVEDAAGRWYRYNNGKFPAGQWKELDNNWYYFDETGFVKTGWYTENEVNYWLGADGVMTKDTVLNIDGINYQFDASGVSSNTYKAPTVIPADSEKSELHLTVDQMADNILAGIVNQEMTQTQKAKAIYKWVRANIHYVNSSEKGDWVKAAYEGLRRKKGDCYTYYSVSLALLSRAGIPSIEVVRSDGHHWWSLVDCGDGWYHFDTCPRASGGEFCLLTDAQIAAYSAAHGQSHAYDQSLYPPTPLQ